jgi:hypothetical protein
LDDFDFVVNLPERRVHDLSRRLHGGVALADELQTGVNTHHDQDHGNEREV